MEINARAARHRFDELPDMAESGEEIISGIDIPAGRPTETELASSLSRKAGTRESASGDARRVLELVDSHVGTAIEPLPVTVIDLSAASRHIRRFDTALRARDAIHTAIASREEMTSATADVRSAEAATALDIDTTLVRAD